MSDASAPKFGSSLREEAIGDLPIFNLATSYANTTPPTLTTVDIVAQQYRQISKHAHGLQDLSLATNTETSIRLEHLQGLKESMFGSPTSSTLVSPADRLKYWSDKSPAGFLVCGKIVRSVDASGQPIFGNPVIFAIAAPVFSPQGRAVDPTSLWSSGSKLAPLQVAIPEDPICLVGASIDSESRRVNAKSMKGKFADYLPHLLYCFDGLRMSGAGYVVSQHQPADAARYSVYLDSIEAAAPPLTPMDYWGTGNAPTQLQEGQRLIYLPRVYPLFACHGIPIGQLWDASIGSQGFHEAIATMATNVPAGRRAHLGFLRSLIPLNEWLDAVAAKPEAFVTEFVARISIRDSLPAPMAENPTAEDDLMEDVTWVTTGVVKRLHSDGILGGLPRDKATKFATLERRMYECVADYDSIWITSTADTTVCLWYLRPPLAPTSRLEFKLDQFLKPGTVPSACRDFRVMHVTATTNAAEHRLLTETEAEEITAQNSPTKQANRKLTAALRLQQQQQQQQQSSAANPEVVDLLLSPQVGNGKRKASSMTAPVTESPPAPDRAATVANGATHPLGGSSIPPSLRTSAPGNGSTAALRVQFDNEVDTGAVNRALFPQGAAAAAQFHSPAPAPARQQPALHPAMAASTIPASHISPEISHMAMTPGLSSSNIISQQLADANIATRQQRYQSHPVSASLGYGEMNPYGQFGTFPSLGGQIVNAEGRLAGYKVPSTLYNADDASSWRLDASLQTGPKNYFFLSALLGFRCEHRPAIFVKIRQEVPPSWCLAPARIQVPFSEAFLRPKSTASEALNHLENIISRIDTQRLPPGALIPILHTSFFSGDGFKFFAQTSSWATKPLKTTADMESRLVLLHLFQLAPGMAEAYFPSQGFTRGQMIQALFNIEFLLGSAVGAGYQSSPSILCHVFRDVMSFLQCQLLVDEWDRPHAGFTVLTYDVLEEMFLAVVSWVQTHQSACSLFAEAASQSDGSISILLNPILEWSSLSSSTLLDRYQKWHSSSSDRLTRTASNEPLTTTGHVKRAVLFGLESSQQQFFMVPASTSDWTAMGGGYPAGAAQTPYGAAPAPSVPGTVQQPAYVPAQANPGKGKGKSKTNHANETSVKPSAPAMAKKPLFQWVDPSSATEFGKVIAQLCREHRDDKLKPPSVSVTVQGGSTQMKGICFPFCCASPRPELGCNNTMHKGKKTVLCDRVRIDLADEAWASQPKEAFLQIWDFLQHHAVKKIWVPTDDFVKKME